MAGPSVTCSTTSRYERVDRKGDERNSRLRLCSYYSHSRPYYLPNAQLQEIEDRSQMSTVKTPAAATFEVSPRRAAAAIRCLADYVQERQLAVEKGQITDTITAIKLMSELQFFKEDLAARAKTPAEKLYDTLRFTTVPNCMDGDDITSLGVEAVGKIHLQDDVTVKVEDKPALHAWLVDNELEDIITEQVNAQTLAALVRRRIKDPKLGALPDEKIVTVKPIVRAVIT